jgi:hypothetical protein
MAVHSTGKVSATSHVTPAIMSRRNRPTSIQNPRSPILRAEVAQVAARLMAEGGALDYGMAKRKALKQLGLPESHPLPPNEEVESALREYQHLFLGDEHAEHLGFLRETAVELMRLLAPFHPYLTGSVLDGTAGPYTAIDLLLFADSAKDVEIFLLNEDLQFSHASPRDERIEAVFVLKDEDATANLMVLRPQDERVVFKHRDGRSRERARVEAVEALLRPTLAPLPSL